MRISCLISLLLIAISAVQGEFPTEPSAFASLEAPSFGYSFRQSDCVLNTIPEDGGSGVQISLDTANTDCISRETYDNALIGVSTTSTTATEHFKSSAIGTSLDGNLKSFSEVNFTVGMWISPLSNLSDSDHEYILFSIGGTGGSLNISENSQDTRLVLTYKRNAGVDNDELIFSVIYEDSGSTEIIFEKQLGTFSGDRILDDFGTVNDQAKPQKMVFIMEYL